MALIFKTDRDYDEEMVFEFMPIDGLEKVEELASLLRIDSDNILEAMKITGADLKKLVKYLIDEKYKNISPYIQSAIISYQSSWDKINDNFFSLVAAKTGLEWKYKNYYCVVSAYHEGISSWGGDTIARIWSLNADTQRPVTAHELTLSHFWSILEKKELSKDWPDDKKWKYSEILSWCLLGLDSDFYKFWPWLLRRHRFPLNHEYPEIVSLQKDIGDMYFKYKSFPEFLEAVIVSGRF